MSPCYSILAFGPRLPISPSQGGQRQGGAETEDEERVRSVMYLAVQAGEDGQPPNQAVIAGRLHMDRKLVRGILADLEARQVVLRLAGGGRGCRVRYVRGPAWPGDGEMGTAGGVSLPISRVHSLRVALPIFEDELWYTDIASGLRRPWLLGMWAGDYKAWEHKGARHTLFHETCGTWEIIWYKEPKESYAFGKKGRTALRRRVGTVVLMPSGLEVSPDTLEADPNLLEREAHRLLSEIARNRRLELHGLLLPIRDEEFANLVDDFPDLPPGRTYLAPDVWIDHSKGPPELETNNKEKAVPMARGLQMLRQVPDFPVRLERIEAKLDTLIAAYRRPYP